MKSVVGTIAWLLTSLASINMGLMTYDARWNFFDMVLVQNNFGALVEPLQYAIGVAGVISLVMLVQHCISMRSCGCS